jgi:aryl-alcohol dehydrogenase
MTVTTAAVLRRHDAPFVLEDLTLDALAPNEVLVRIAGVGLCHTDVLPRIPFLGERLGPIVLGHEGSGVVESVGSAVRGITIGDHVVLSYDSCGRCTNCLDGAATACPQFDLRNLSGRRPDYSAGATDSAGAPIATRWFGQSSFASYAVATERNLVVVDPALPLEILGPLGCGIQTGAGTVLSEMALRPGQSIVVFGAGAVGLAAVMAARLAGASEIVAVDLHRSRLELATELGATRTVLGDDPDLDAVLKDGSEGFDYALDTTSVPAVIVSAITALRRPGHAVIVGGAGGELRFQPSILTGKKLSYALEGNVVPQVFIPKMLRWWADGRFPFDRLLSTYPLTEINRAEADATSGLVVKPVLLP